jgi:hypothetical protein
MSNWTLTRHEQPIRARNAATDRVDSRLARRPLETARARVRPLEPPLEQLQKHLPPLLLFRR